MTAERLVIRGFAHGKLQFEDHTVVDADNFVTLISSLATKHAAAMAAHELHMIEIEFLDAPENERFCRFGTDPSGMTIPIRINLDGKVEVN
jgi:hypothetical protein